MVDPNHNLGANAAANTITAGSIQVSPAPPPSPDPDKPERKHRHGGWANVTGAFAGVGSFVTAVVTAPLTLLDDRK